MGNATNSPTFQRTARQTVIARPLIPALWWLWSLCLFTSGCGDFSCSGPGYELAPDDRFTPAQVIDPAIELTITREGGDFIEAEGLTLVQTLLGLDGRDGWIDVSALINEYLSREPITFFNVTAREIVAAIKLPDPDGLKITFLDGPPRVRVEISRVWVRLEATVVDGNTRSACRIRGDVETASAATQRMFTLENVAVDIVLATSASGGFDIQSDLINVDIQDSGIHFVTDSGDPWYYCNYPECDDGFPPQCGECYLVCGAAGFATDVGNFFVELFDQIVVQLTEILVNVLLDRVEVLSGRLHPALLLGAVLPELHDTAMLKFGLKPATSLGSFRVSPLSDGLGDGGDLGVRLALGVEPEVAHPCVSPLGPSPTFLAPSDPGFFVVNQPAPGRPEMAATASQAVVNHLLWALYGGGALCLDIDTDFVKRLTQDQIDLSVELLSLILPDLETLAEPQSPLFLSLRPRLEASQFPIVRFGGGDTAKAADSLLEISLPNTELGIYARVDGHYVRLLEASLSLSLGVTPIIMPDTSLSLGVDHVEITNLAVLDDRLFASVELQKMLEFITTLMTNVLLTQDFALPIPIDTLVQQILGIPLDIRLGEFVRLGTANDWLALQIGLSSASGNGSLGVMANTHIDLESREVTQGESFVVSVLGDEPIEVQYQIDSLAWSGFQPGPDIFVKSGLLNMPGEHVVRLRARHQGDFKSLDMSPAEMQVTVLEREVVVDVPPIAESDNTGCQVKRNHAPQRGSWLWVVVGVIVGGGLLRRHGQTPILRGPGAARSRQSHETASRARVWGAQPQKKISIQKKWLLWGVAPHPSGAARPCTCAGRERRPDPALWLLLLCCVLAACDDEAAEQRVACVQEGDCITGQYCGCDGFCTYPLPCASAADCCGGRACTNGTCESAPECRTDSECSGGKRCQSCQCARPTCDTSTDCPAPQVCQSGQCLPPGQLACAGLCTDAEVCVAARDVCIDRNNICPSTTCAPGEQLVLSGQESFIGDQCSYEDLGCVCVTSPPLAGPQPGGHLAITIEDTGRYHIAAYERAFGDLLWLKASADLTPSPASFIDGIPTDTRPAADPTGPRGGISLPGPDIGQHASVVYTAADVLAFASYDATNGALRLALRPSDNNWRTFTVDDTADSGRYASIAALSDGRLVIAYQTRDLDADGHGQTFLKVAVARTTKPSSDADFSILTIEQAAADPAGLPCAGACAASEVCWASDLRCGPPTTDCRTACWGDSACLNTVCAPTITASRPPHHDAIGTGVNPHIITRNQEALIVYYQAHLGRLALASGAAGGPYTLTTLDTGTNRAGFGFTDVGRQPRAALDPSQTLHIAYHDDIQGSLRYLSWDTTTNLPIASSEIDGGLALNPSKMIGGVDIALRGQTPSVAYHDATNGLLLGARLQPDGEWLQQTLGVQDITGLSPAIAADGSKILVLSGRLTPTADGFVESLRLMEWP